MKSAMGESAGTAHRVHTPRSEVLAPREPAGRAIVPFNVVVVSRDRTTVAAINEACAGPDLRATVAVSIDDACGHAKRGEADLAFVDQSISAEAPIELARRLRHTHCLDWTPIVAIGDRIDLQSSLGTDGIGLIDALLATPLDRDELIAQTRATRRLMGLRRAYRSTLGRVSEAAIVVDGRGRVHEWNAAAQRLFQWAAGDMLGQSISRLMPQERAVVHDEYVGRYLRTGQGRVIGADHERAELRHRAAHDALSALPNRACALEELRCRCEQSARDGAVFAIAYLDLDRFKPINDNFGHRVGDDVLKVVARRLRNALGEQDFVARLGGDEFLLVVDGIDDRPHALRVVERARAATTRPIAVDGHSLRVGVTAGIAIWGEDAKEPETLLQLADRAMYRAKNGRR